MYEKEIIHEQKMTNNFLKLILESLDGINSTLKEIKNLVLIGGKL